MAAALALAASPSPASAVDVDVGDSVPAPAGVTAGLVYGQYAERSTLYSDGRTALKNAQLRSSVGILRVTHYFDVAGTRGAVNALVPVGSLSASGSLSGLGATTEVGDPVLAVGLWPVNAPDAKRYLGVAAYVFAPFGQYDRTKGLNLGANRWEGAIQGAFVQGFAERWAVELIADAAFFTENRSFGPAGATMKQAPLFQAQGFLSYSPTPATRVALGVSELAGGRTTVEGVDQRDTTSTLKASATLAAWLSPTNQLLATVGRDLSVRNGLAEDFRLNFRVLHVF
jgi:hypothetical protein